MSSTKRDSAARAALAALHIGETEQVRRMPRSTDHLDPIPPAVKKVQVSVQFSMDGLALLQKAQARLLERGIRRAGNKGTALEIVLTEWLAKRQE
jgi:hypothetical protein